MIINHFSVILRTIEMSDMEFLQMMMNDPEIEYFMVDKCLPVSMDRQIKWFQNYDQQKELRLMIEIKNGKTLGMISLTNINYMNRSAMIGIKTKATASDRTKNDLMDAMMGILNYGFNELNLNCMYSTILEYNYLSRKINKKCGAVEEGLLRERVFKNGKYNNIIPISFLASEFNPLYDKYKNERLKDV